METIHLVLDTKLLQATDRAARRTKLNRSALIREAIRSHLQRLWKSAIARDTKRCLQIGPRLGAGRQRLRGRRASPRRHPPISISIRRSRRSLKLS